MAQLVVGNLPRELIRIPKRRSVTHRSKGKAEKSRDSVQSTEDPPRRPVADVLASLPNVGYDDDFLRHQSPPEVDRQVSAGVTCEFG